MLSFYKFRIKTINGIIIKCICGIAFNYFFGLFLFTWRLPEMNPHSNKIHDQNNSLYSIILINILILTKHKCVLNHY